MAFRSRAAQACHVAPRAYAFGMQTPKPGSKPTPDILPACEVLRGFEEADRRALTAHGEFLRLAPEQVVIREGDDQDCLFMLLHGVLRALHQVSGGATPIGTIQAGEWFGEVNIFDPQKASAMVAARTESIVWRMSRTQLEAFLNASPALGCLLLLGVGEVLARRTRGLLAKLNATWELSW
jgi:CRP/FNR family transcriptional regulator, cyclic AMP receptor protein